MQKKTLLLLSTLFLISGCKKGNESSQSSISSSNSSSSSSSINESTSSSSSQISDSTSSSSSSSIEEEPGPIGPYEPTTFSTSTYKETRTTLAEGIEYVKVEYVLESSDADIIVNIIEADPTKVNVVAGTTNNSTENLDGGASYSTSVPYSQASAYTQATGKKFYAVTNADFFSYGNGRTVNAFVKDGKIIKKSHNSDLKDIPESKPMLFGVNAEGKAQIAPIVKNLGHSATNPETINSSFSYGVDLYDSNNNLFRTKAYIDTKTYNEDVGVICNGHVDVSKDRVLIELEKDEADKGKTKFHATVKSVELVSKRKTVSAVLTSATAYVVLSEQYLNTYKVGDKAYVGYVNSDDGTWYDYDTIIGGRHSLIEDGILPETLFEEGLHTANSNGVRNRVPRTAIGVKENGNVVIVSVEDLHYKVPSEYTCTGLTIVQMADLMRYYGCRDAVNFDGGGSSQLIILNPTTSQYEVVTRSSDTQSTNLTSSRQVANTIIFAEK